MAKAREALAGAESETANGRYNNAANRCYYSSFHAAIHALERAGFAPRSARGSWSHEAVQAVFIGQLVNRRKQYPAELRAVLPRNQELRNAADYDNDFVTQIQAARASRRTREFLQQIEQGGKEV